MSCSADGKLLPAMKPTRFLTSSPQMASRLSIRCDKSHTHQQLVGGRCKNAAFYPLRLARQNLLGMRDTSDAAARAKASMEEVAPIFDYDVDVATDPGGSGSAREADRQIGRYENKPEDF